jgi:peptide deformylase
VSLLPLIEYPDLRLRRSAALVTEFDESLARLADDLLETLYASGGIGLAATQVGDERQVLVMDLSDDRSQPQVFVNPQVRLGHEKCMVEESCLSLPGIVGNVARVSRLIVRAHDTAGQTFERELEGMHAVCMQHEMDHLAGTLFIDRLPFARRLWIKAGAAVRGWRSAPSVDGSARPA